MIYTCYEMIQDCRAGKPAGWRYFVTEYVPVMRRLLEHYFPERASDRDLLERVLAALYRPESSLFASLEPAPERAFVAELRQHLLAAVEADRASAAPEIELDLETLASALEPLTLVEKQAVWTETMRYGAPDAARILHIDARTVEKNRGRAAELVRGKLDTWRQSLLADNGAALGRAAAASRTAACCPAKTFFNAMDGRLTWRDRENMEAHAAACPHCVDHYCRLLEVADLLRTAQPLSPEAAQPYWRRLGLETPKVSVWKKMFAP
ncbi:MAG TPA: zf-HC2 domain-containing protein [Bryobacteraceae bacterium]|nr:zf-HC2 domain-containing protein [Bryobacteraceae bacterium]